MDFGGHEEEIGMPMPVSYDTIHESSKLKLLSTVSNGGGGEEIQPEPAVAKKGVRYRECLKNHAASIGGHAVDGCGDFMPSGDEGTLEALKCGACGCHRNFHRREVEGEPYCYFCKDGSRKSRSAFVPINPHGHGHAPLALPLPPHMAAFCSSSSGGEGEEHDHMNAAAVLGMAGAAMGAAGMPMRKRFRTKFTQDQKDKMFAFAEKIGWRIQKHDEAAVQQFCNEVGVKRHVLKVWMHNNKHTLGKKV